MFFSHDLVFPVAVILIESQWNLNDRPRLSILLQININRIAVEFKCFNGLSSSCTVIYINRITVEFKYSFEPGSSGRNGILIESQWNLNDAEQGTENDGN